MKKNDYVVWLIVTAMILVCLATCGKSRRRVQLEYWEWFSNDSVLILKK